MALYNAMGPNRTFVFLFLISVIVFLGSAIYKPQAPRIVSYTVNPNTQQLRMYWRNERSEPFRSIGNLKNWLAQKKQALVFAMNGGMYKTDNSPLGLYIENQKLLSKLNTASASGNFYMKPNGVFYITTDKKANVVTTGNFRQHKNIAYATQSGPMLVINDTINTAFKKGSANLNIRNGVGILPGNKMLFAMSEEPVNFYDFASFFKQAGCKNALYLDGFVSRTYLPEKEQYQTDGDFGVIIAVTQP